LGLGDIISKYGPNLVPGFNNIVDISAGYTHSIILNSNGIAFSAGRNSVILIILIKVW
jgi:alpha-tubulin suppressor-like RCC1 family protein